ncbi:meiosis-specific kinetochore protein [Manis pentadactyla]|uniref:meiosis-specific kinetochore protein n=1 Tax=Manis pentadactyla TaxID=143292 RepID=UPI00255C4996|nr:meiosis-specific kinetochore protein [Manis pentadactyla]
MWSLRVYTRKKRTGRRLNVTPTPDPALPATAEGPAGPGRRLSVPWKPRRAGLRSATGGGQARRAGRRGLGPRAPRDPQADVQGVCPETCRPFSAPKGNGRARGLPKIAEKAEQSGQGGSQSGPPSTQLGVTGEKSLNENNTSEETQDEKIAPLSESVTDGLQVDSSSSKFDLLSELSLQDISSSLLSDSVIDAHTEYKSFEESLSSFPSPELFRRSDYLDWECPVLEEHRQRKNSTLLDTSKAVSIEKAPQFPNLSAILDNTTCEVLLAEKTYSSTSEKTKKKNTNPSTQGEKSRGPLTSTPSSQKGALVIDLSSVQKASFEELFPHVSNYVNSNEIVPVSSLQENSANEVPSNSSEICYIIRASPGTRKVKSKGITLKKKKYSPPKDIPQEPALSAP